MRACGMFLICLAAFLFAALTAAAPSGGVSPRDADCRYQERSGPTAVPDPGPQPSWWLPADDLFRPLLADMKQPRGYLSYRSMEFLSGGLPAGGQDDRITAGIVGVGKEFGLWRRSPRHRCDGLQVNLLGAVFSQFNLDTESYDLINSDFLVGPEVTLRRGALSGRLRLYHQSSHLGDEFLLNNPGVDRINLSFEAFDGLFSLESGRWRFYAGGGYILSTETGLARGLAQGGTEFRSRRCPWRSNGCEAVFGADLQWFEERDWDVTTSLMGGIELASPAGTNRFRVLLAYLKGSIIFGQFFNTEEVENYGLQLHFDF